uniref:phenylalanyl tRNA synthetase beta subunit n=1 Tax=Microzonia abyssicola TaxID=217214 RepID=UPI002E78329E|nr:phenylalanyl tRNA synthetase beta subunit [Syringoderma abyssicola]WAM65085.1 phenylalanyl tRNA synthetase beta subunit [Syringoderma abyssicola]
MDISLKWIEQLIGLKSLSLNDLVDRLTLAGFEIESISNKKILESKSNDFILDISFTANRNDVSNIKGFVFELFSLFNSSLHSQTPAKIKLLISLSKSKKNLKFLQSLSNENFGYKYLLESPDFKLYSDYKYILFKYCLWEHYLQKKYFNRVIKILSLDQDKQSNFISNSYTPLFNIKSKKLTVAQSPLWIKKRLLIMDFKPINNVIDTVNYLLIETGQVFFTYDIQNLKKFTRTSSINFVPRYANNRSLFSITKSKVIKLNEKILTLTLNNKIISIAGLIQDLNTLVNKDTSQILIQSGLYDSKKVKQSSKILGLRTEYSIRLEKQTDLNSLEQAYLRLTHLFWVQGIKFETLQPEKILFTPNNTSYLFSKYIKGSQANLKIFYKNISNLIGPYKNLTKIHNLQVIKSLKLLNFKISYKTDQNCYILVPLTRQLDLEREVDIIEEIVRIIGFNKFKPILPHINGFGNITKLEKFKRRLRIGFVNFGFNESLHSILSNQVLIHETQLENPLFNESSVLRISLLEALIEKVRYNKNYVGKTFETFELGRVYKFLSNSKKEESELLSGVFGGRIFRSNWEKSTSTINWFEAKGILENIFNKVNVSVNWMPARFKCPTNFHPNRTTNIFIGQQIIGTFGQIHPSLTLKNNLSRKTYLFELNIEVLNRFWQNKTSINYVPYSSYPISYVDLSCIVKKSLSFNDIRSKIYIAGKPLLKSIDLFDYYSKAPIKEGYCSLSFKLQFKSKTRTLVNSEVNQVIESIIIFLKKSFDIEFH